MWYPRPPQWARIQAQPRSAALTIMFMPWASPVENRKLTITSRPTGWQSSRSSLPWRVVDSAAARISGKAAWIAAASW